MLKTPINNDVTTTITATLTATPLDNAEANGVEETEIEGQTPDLYTYSINNVYNHNTIGQALNGEQLTFNETKIRYGHPAATAHIISNGVISESYIAFEKNGKAYYIRGGAGDESEQSSKPVYDANKAELKKAYGQDWDDYCSEVELRWGVGYFNCNDDNLNITFFMDGSVDLSGAGWTCNITGINSYCT